MNTLALRSEASPSPVLLRRAGLGVSALATLLLLTDAASQLLLAPPVLEGARQLGFSVEAHFWRTISVVLLFATTLYAIPRTAFFGAVLVTGFLGGAICAHVRVGDDIMAPTLISFVLAALAWGGLALRDPRYRALVMGA
jgi:hypothetical protein